MISTDNKATLVVNPTTGKIQYHGFYVSAKYYTVAGFEVYDLYVLSDDEIDVGDWVKTFRNNGGVRIVTTHHCKTIDEVKTAKDLGCKKIIATTNSDITETTVSICKISEKFIDDFIYKYNSDCMITEVFVEYDRHKKSSIANILCDDGLFVPKLTTKNEIVMTEYKQSYTREEVIEICRKTSEALFIHFNEKYFYEQLNKNL